MKIKSSLVPVVEKISLSEKSSDVLVLPAFEGPEWPSVTKSFDQKVGGTIARVAKRDHFDGKSGKTLWVEVSSKTPKVLLVGLGKRKDLTAPATRDAYASAASEISSAKLEEVSIAYPEGKEQELFESAIEGFLLATYRFNKYKAKPERPQTIKKISILVPDAKAKSALESSLQRIQTYVDATFLARDLSNEPANVVNPEFMEKLAASVAKEQKLKITVLHENELRKRGMNLIVAVGQGGLVRPRLVHMEYKPKKKAKRTVALVGKGVCFDSGGLSLKPQDYMYGMKADMSGSADVLATMWAAAELELPVHVHGLFPLVENMPSHEAVKPGDIFVALNGKSVEIENTDAEGRLILADTLCYVKDLNVDEVIDCATLTGAVVVALGEDIAGVFSENDALTGRILKASERAGEKLWRLPMEKPYGKLLKSDVADMKNVAGRYGGAITAAVFLSEFAPENVPWAHLDIAGPSHISSDWPTCIKGGTGFIVRTFLEFLSN